MDDNRLARYSMKTFSVLISVYKYDKPVFFRNALDSITKKQTIMPSEIVLIVDGPVDKRISAVINSIDKECPGLYPDRDALLP